MSEVSRFLCGRQSLGTRQLSGQLGTTCEAGRAGRPRRRAQGRWKAAMMSQTGSLGQEGLGLLQMRRPDLTVTGWHRAGLQNPRSPDLCLLWGSLSAAGLYFWIRYYYYFFN